MAKASADAVERPAAKRRTATANFFDLGREEWRPLSSAARGKKFVAAVGSQAIEASAGLRHDPPNRDCL
ncbi:MAG TPA: hypothetical protein DEA50_10470 [Parvularcula sp.]|nr:hypothetical protein [Parvularcula sp.]